MISYTQKLFKNIIPEFIQILVVLLLVAIALICAVITLNEIRLVCRKIIDLKLNAIHVDAFFLHISNAILAIEFMLLVVKYFREHFHFPLRYVIYIGVTSIVRHMIVSHENLLKGAIASLILVVAYCLLCIKNYKIGKEKYE